jgi:gamma-glutamylcyclotransferase (GGCT)/AIG2-like uncharacterized protein YtfP
MSTTLSFASDIFAVFVYGTLKRGHLRSTFWPRPPIIIRQAIVEATLFDRGPYPAALAGGEPALGELWEFQPDDIPETLRVVDEIEGYSSLREDNDYLRCPIDATPIDDNPTQSTVRAWIYLSPGEARLIGARRIKPFKEIASEVQGNKLDWHKRLAAAWPDPHSRVPRSFSEE